MGNIHELIFESFDVISLILVFVFVLFDIKYPKIREQLGKSPPPVELEKAYAAYRRDMRVSLAINVIPLIVIDGALLYIFLPVLIQVLAIYKPSLWNFDFVQTAFLMVILLVSVFFFWSLYLGALHIKRLLKTK